MYFSIRKTFRRTLQRGQTRRVFLTFEITHAIVDLTRYYYTLAVLTNVEDEDSRAEIILPCLLFSKFAFFRFPTYIVTPFLSAISGSSSTCSIFFQYIACFSVRMRFNMSRPCKVDNPFDLVTNIPWTLVLAIRDPCTLH